MFQIWNIARNDKLSLLITKICLNNITKRLNLELFYLSTARMLVINGAYMYSISTMSAGNENRLTEKKLNCIYEESRPTQLEHATLKISNTKSSQSFLYKSLTRIIFRT